MVRKTSGDRTVAKALKAYSSRRSSAPFRVLRYAPAVTGLVAAFLLGFGPAAFCQEHASPVQTSSTGLVLARAGICESVENLNPINTAAVFSVTQGQIYCFSDFGSVRSQTVVYHRWYHRDALTTQIRLKIYPPRWATYSMLKLREVDKGPWRVEITDTEGRVLSVLRFSIVD